MKTVIVLGMHRSGTSSVARALNAMGVELGSNLLEAKKENSKGFWEDRELVNINTQLMKLSGQDWHTFGEIQTYHDNELFGKAADYLALQHSKYPVWGFKDPRTTRLLPFWDSVVEKVGSESHYCVVIRNPLSVVKSLESRNSFSAKRAALLWYIYYMDLLVTLVGRRFTVVDYDQLMSDSRNEITRLAKGLGQEATLTEASVNDYCNEFLSKSLRHSKFSLEDLKINESISSDIEELYLDLIQLSKQSQVSLSESLKEKVVIWKLTRAQFEDFFDLINKLGESEERLSIALKHLEQTLAERDHILHERDILEEKYRLALESISSYEIELSVLSPDKSLFRHMAKFIARVVLKLTRNNK